VLDGGRTDFAKVQRWLDRLSDLVESRNLHGLLMELCAIVPQYHPSAEVLALADVDRYDYSRRYSRDRLTLSTTLPAAVA
jgi:hypothetical protein